MSSSWKQRLWFIPLALISCAYPFLHRALAEARIYDIRWAGGLHPSDILQLHGAGQLAAYAPVVVVLAAVISFVRPAVTSAAVAVSVAACLIAQLLFLACAVFVIVLRVAAPNT